VLGEPHARLQRAGLEVAGQLPDVGRAGADGVQRRKPVLAGDEDDDPAGLAGQRAARLQGAVAADADQQRAGGALRRMARRFRLLDLVAVALQLGGERATAGGVGVGDQRARG
jgi:hypothetical protein